MLLQIERVLSEIGILLFNEDTTAKCINILPVWGGAAAYTIKDGVMQHLSHRQVLTHLLPSTAFHTSMQVRLLSRRVSFVKMHCAIK
ncbi:hypothetical protein PRUB_b0743 [Pseudoalteromonas rubra]|uniref:Uncharacterized protein n=1 Tax=Pseudoalteromonas rubra TaxID=43658 RepID=A0A8T0C1H3_9GAMM|nr:hypothetical protein PRUB_b0743 [Pseudoalteromonas rubra]